MGNAKSKSSRFDSYTVKGPPHRSNSDPSSILYLSQKQQYGHKSGKKQSKKSKKSSKTNGKTHHASSNSITLPSTSSSLTMLNDPRGEIIMSNSSSTNFSGYSTSLPQSNNNSSSRLFSEEINIEEEFKKLNLNLDFDFSTDNEKDKNEEKRYTQYYGKNSSSKSTLYDESKKSQNSHSEDTSYKTSISRRSNEELGSYSSKQSRDELNKPTRRSKEDLRKSSKRSDEDLRKPSRRSDEDLRKPSRRSDEDLRKSSRRSDEDLNRSHHHSSRHKRSDEDLHRSHHHSSRHKHSDEDVNKISSRHKYSDDDIDSRSSRHRQNKEELKKSSKSSQNDIKKPIIESNNISTKLFDDDELMSFAPRNSLPIPSTVELNRLSKEVMDVLKLPDDSREFISELPNSQKWELIQKYYNPNGNDSAEIYCISYTQRLKENPFDKEIISDIATALHTHIVSDIIDKFINYGGVQLLISNLKQLEEDDKDYGPNYDEIESLYIQCIKAIMNHSSGLETMMDDPKSIIVIALCLRSSSLRTRCLASEILAAVCLIPKGHKYVLQALTDFKDIAGETKRFETVVRGLILDRRRKYKNETVDRDLQLASLSLINSIISGGQTQLTVEFRTHLRYEFTNLGILEILEKLKGLNDSRLSTQINIFESSANKDEEELYKRFNCNSSDADAVLLFESLNNSMKDTRCYKYFINMLKHSLLMPKDSGERTAMWMLIDQLTQNIVLKNNDTQSDPQAALLDINVERVIDNIKTMETVLNKQDSTPSSPLRPSHSRTVSHSYSQKRKLQQNRRKSLNRKISFDANMAVTHSPDSSFSADISARNSIKRRTTAYNKKKKHSSYGRTAKYTVLKTSLVKKINEVARLTSELNKAKKDLANTEQILEKTTKEIAKRDEMDSFYLSESSSFSGLKSASSNDSINNRNSMILKGKHDKAINNNK
ncbi:hypothetical protein PIROE2DRAFT_5635 [Piromyces sp. E2]|nr:hypothetical protein PIROE2DRAFT_5635 [Piromyces sp. E2]|eukprot:OUM67025.1 hypothetical protein PIROE2DRAFT_5635 [Piromyces sp. E2]